MRTRTRLALGILLAALLPIGVAGGVSIAVARRTAEREVTEGNLNTATQAAGRIAAFLRNHEQILAALAQTVSSTSHLTERQTEAVLRNHVLDFAAFHELAIHDVQGKPRLSLRRGPARDLEAEPELARKAAATGKPVLGRYYLGEDLQPGVAIAVPVLGLEQPEGALVAQVELIELWRLVDQIRVGETGYAVITDGEGRVLAGGAGPLKAQALLGELLPGATGVRDIYAAGQPHAGLRTGALGTPVLGAEVPLPPYGVLVAVEQPAAEAFASARALGWQMAVIAALAALFGLAISVSGSRRPLRAIGNIGEVVRAVARGDFGVRASEHGDDELAELARDVNTMTARLRELTDEVRRHERLSVFSRVAAGLAHDLKHPLKNLENQARLLLEDPEDARFRETFRRTVERDFSMLDRFLGNLHDLTQPPELTPVPLDPRALAESAAEGVAGQAARAGVSVSMEVPGGLPRLVGDRITLERALKNLLVNAVEASPSGATVRLVAEVDDGFVGLSVVDQGSGIPPERLPRLFEEFATTKRSGKGLGLGLALTSRLVREQGGSIHCTSRVGEGSTFRVRLPRHAESLRESA